MKRRAFAKVMLGAPLLAGCATTGAGFSSFGRKAIKPPRLEVGDYVGLIAPASAATEEKVEKAIFNLEKLGLKVKLAPHTHSKNGFLAGKDDERIDDLHRMFEDETIKAIWAVRGGYGTTRIIDQLDYKLIAKNPKVLIGYSDITALLQAVYVKTGLIGYHGPVGSSNFSAYNQKYLKKVLFEGHPKMSVNGIGANPMEINSPNYQHTVITPGKMSGRLFGGNLSLMASLAGTKYLPDFMDNIVFLEDIGEEPYRVDRMLTQLLTATDLKLASGILLGVFTDCEAKNPKNSYTLQEVLRDRLGSLGIPVFYGLSFGHIDDQFTIPIGIQAHFNTSDRELVYLEQVVS